MPESKPPTEFPQAEGESDNPLDSIAEEFAARLRAGQRPSISEYISRYPELAEDIAEVFPTMAMLEQFGNEGSLSGEKQFATPCLEQIGEYRIVREIGRGGMGVVYEAEHSAMRRRVALKVMPAEMARNATHLRRFRREAQAAGGLHHTNIVPVFEVGQQDGIHFYAMQYIRGQSLDQVIKELRKLVQAEDGDRPMVIREMDDTESHGRRDSVAARLLAGFAARSTNTADKSTEPSSWSNESWGERLATGADATPSTRSPVGTTVFPHSGRSDYFRRVARLGLQVAEAMAYAHDQGVLHRDIKPSNLILDTAGTVWITDFGLAKHEEDDLTRTGDIVGTLRYLAPERLNGQADARSDIYALGLTLYELCSWRPAFDESDRVRLVKQITSERPPSPRRVNRHVPRDLETIILKAIDKHPGSRYQTAEQMADDLRLFITDRPVQSRRIPVSEKLWRWCRRNPVVAGLAASVLLLASTLFVGSIWFGITSSRQAEKLRIQSAQVQHSEKEALTALFDARRSHARAARFSGRRGQRVDGLQALREAVWLLPRLALPEEDRQAARLGLRNDAIASLANPDWRIERAWEVREPWTTYVDFDPDFQRYAQTDLAGEVVIRQVADNKELARLPSPGWPAWELQFSPDGNYLAVKYHPPRMRTQMIAVWDLATGQPLLQDRGPFFYAPFSFTPDSRSFVTCLEDRRLRIYDLPAGKLREVSPQIDMQPMKVVVDPSGDSFVANDATTFHVKRYGFDGQERDAALIGDYVRGMAFSADGSVLAAGDEVGNIYLWNARVLSDAPRILKGHTAAVVNLFFNHHGDRLASYSWDGTTRLWDLQTNGQLVRADAVRLLGNQFSKDDQYVGYASKRDEFGIWQTLDRGPVHLLTSSVTVRSNIAFSLRRPSLAISATSDGVELWDTNAQHLLGRLSSGPTASAVILPDESAILCCGQQGVQRWPIALADSTWRIGPPEVISTAATAKLEIDAQGQSLVALQDNTIVVFDLTEDTPTASELGVHPGSHQVFISPDGKWIVSTTWQLGSGIWIWDRSTGERVKELEPDMGAATAAFSPDGQWLATCVWKNLAVWKVGTWERQTQVERPADDDWSPALAFSSDSKTFATLFNRRSIQLLDAATGERLAIIESSDPGMIGDVEFNSAGSTLGAVADRRLLLWNLDQLHDQLALIHLGWESLPTPPESGADVSVPHIEIVAYD